MAPIKVFIESPFSGDLEANRSYLFKCTTWCYTHDKAPLALHAIYPYLPDGNLHSDSEVVITDQNIKLPGRDYALECNRAWREVADEIWFFMDNGLSSGMLLGLMQALLLKTPVIMAFFTKEGHENILKAKLKVPYLLFEERVEIVNCLDHAFGGYTVGGKENEEEEDDGNNKSYECWAG